jgi:predicted dienelactone hydrolase
MQGRPVAPVTRANKSIGLQIAKVYALTGKVENMPLSAPTPVVSVSPVVLSAPGRIVDLQIGVSAPAVGRDLHIILFSHGGGKSNHLSSPDGYGPVVGFWAAHGFAAIQPTHLSSNSLGLDPKTLVAALFWRSRVKDPGHSHVGIR